MLRRWLTAATILAAGLLLTVLQQNPAYVIAGALLAAAFSPLAFPRAIPAAEARRRSAEDGRAIIYWRPGCPFCVRLRATLGLRGHRAHWVDIWQDPDGAADVRAVAGGNETVPTVILGGTPHINPNPRWLRTTIGA